MDRFCIVVHGFDGFFIDPKIELGEHCFLMAPEHPGELSERFKATVSCPSEPAFQILCCLVLTSVIPQSPEHIFAEVCPYDFEIALEKVRKRDFRAFGGAPRIFQLHVFSPFKGFTTLLGQCLNVESLLFIILNMARKCLYVND